MSQQSMLGSNKVSRNIVQDGYDLTFVRDFMLNAHLVSV